jgi:hypothetical protein
MNDPQGGKRGRVRAKPKGAVRSLPDHPLDYQVRAAPPSVGRPARGWSYSPPPPREPGLVAVESCCRLLRYASIFSRGMPSVIHSLAGAPFK